MLLPAAFYQRNTKDVAQELLGKVLCFQNSKLQFFQGRIVEVEAYLGIDDPACHTFQGRRTERVQSMYLPGGHAYIYMIYGIHFCLNVVTMDEAHPEAVLIRALEPMEPLNLKTNGPGKLCSAFGLTKKQDGLALFSEHSPLWIEDDGFQVTNADFVKASRIGVEYAKEAALWPLRFFIKGNPHVSRKK
jgi:DNA-3-methyladenine glycosylase